MPAEPSARAGVVVTGAATGIGRGVAAQLAEVGHAVVALDLRKPDPADRLPGVRYVTGDATDRAAVSRACSMASELSVQGLGGFVANAGVASVAASLDVAMDDWRRVLQVNLESVLIGAQVAALAFRDGGSIVAVSSLAARLGLPGRAAYGASKAGALGLVRSLAAEWGPTGVRVNAVLPGYINTELSRESRSRGNLPPEDEVAASIPLRRLGEPADVGRVVRFLVSDDAAYLTGLALPVDGGLGSAWPL